MSTQLLFYERVTPVALQRHKNWSVAAVGDYEFARKANAVPLNAVEIPLATREYTVVFSDSGDGVIPLAVLGVEGGSNLYIDEAGLWDARYVPAYVRRYPFVFAKSKDGEMFTLCVDENFSGWNQEDRGNRLFDDEGGKTPFVENVLGFLQDYQNHYQRTLTFCQKLQDLKLLEPMQAEFTLTSGEKRSLRGFMTISRDQLKSLSAETLSGLAKTDELELIYAHINSMNNFSMMLERVMKHSQAEATPASQEGSSAQESSDERRTDRIDAGPGSSAG
jgi:hypothetical protein